MKEKILGKRIHHKMFGEGVITGLSGEIITVQFQNEEKSFVIPGAFQSGFLTTEDEALLKCVEEEAKRKEPNAPQKLKTEKAVSKKSNGTKTPVVFCNIMWQERYDGSDEKGINGGSYVKENGTGNEYMNFLPFEVQENGSDRRMIMGEIKGICISERRGTQKHEIPEVNLVEGWQQLEKTLRTRG